MPEAFNSTSACPPTVRSARPALGTAFLGLACGLAAGAFLLARSGAPSSAGSAPDEKPGAVDPAAKLPVMPVCEPGGWLDAAMQAVDPLKTDWDTEAFQVSADGRLKLLSRLPAHPEELDAARVSVVAAADFRCARLRPAATEVYRDKTIAVSRAPTGRGEPPPAFHGPAGLAAALRELADLFAGSTDLRPEFKTYKVELGADAATTVALVEIFGTTPRGRLQVNSRWRCTWKHAGRGSTPALTSITALEHEEAAGGARPFFEDCTVAVLGANPSYREQLLHGLDHWRARIETGMGIDPTGLNGLAVGDVDGDGLEDLYLCRPGGLPNKLFLRNADGTLRDASAGSGVDLLDRTAAALILDLDNDGKADMAVAAGNRVLFLQGDGSGKFALRARLPTPGGAYSLAAADFDDDGFVDVYVCCNELAGLSLKDAADYGLPVPFHDANNGAPNVLEKNDGKWGFTDVTRAVGLDVNNRRFSYAAAWEDFDNDGRIDLCVANDFGRKNLYRNLGGRFVDVAGPAGAEDMGAGMSASWADLNNDGFMDLYFGNMFSKAGNRIAFQQRFKQADEKTVEGLRRFSQGNTLLVNKGDGTFADATVDAGVRLGRWAWGSNFVDVNNDGLPDILVADGYLTTDDPGDL
jgi:hypothetical protein